MPENRKKKKKKQFYIIPLFTAMLFPSPASGQGSWVSNDNAVHNTVWETRLYNDIDFLSGELCEGRSTGSRGGTEAAFWLCRKFKKAGLIPFGSAYARHIYAGRGLVGHNIMGMIPGSLKKHCDSYVIIGAHYDHIGKLDGRIYPGADRNASGTVALTTLADMFSSMKILGRTYDCNIIFVAFDGNECNLAGSESLWKSISEGSLTDPVSGKAVTKEKIRLMVNIDQLGTTMSPLSSGREDFLIMLGNESLKEDEQGILSMCNRFYDTDLELSYTYYGSRNFTDIFYRLSDQKYFVENHIPAVLFTSGITMNNNKTYDTADTLDYEVMRRRIILIFHWIEKML